MCNHNYYFNYENIPLHIMGQSKRINKMKLFEKKALKC